MSTAAPKKGASAADQEVRIRTADYKKLCCPAVPRRSPEAGNPLNGYSDMEP